MTNSDGAAAFKAIYGVASALFLGAGGSASFCCRGSMLWG